MKYKKEYLHLQQCKQRGIKMKKRIIGSYQQIKDYGLFDRLRLTEKLDLLGRYLMVIPMEGDSAPSIRATKEQIETLQDLDKQMVAMVNYRRVKLETPKMKELSAARDKLVRFVLSRIFSPQKLPLESERKAAKVLSVKISHLRGFSRRAQLKRSEAADVVLSYLENPEYAEETKILGIDQYAPELKRLIEEYGRLNNQRDHQYTLERKLPSVYSLMQRAIGLLTDINVQANACVVFQPNDKVLAFVESVNFIYDDVRASFKQRKKRRKKTKAEGAGSGKKVAKKISPKA